MIPNVLVGAIAQMEAAPATLVTATRSMNGGFPVEHTQSKHDVLAIREVTLSRNFGVSFIRYQSYYSRSAPRPHPQSLRNHQYRAHPLLRT